MGQGAFGMVFKGSYEGNLCAVKVLHHFATELTTDLPGGEGADEAVKAFAKECDFLKSFKHPNIVQCWVTEKHPKSGNTILVTELMDCNLRSYLSDSSETSLSSACQTSLSKDVASGLAYIHSRKVIHRDLCGDNVLLKRSQPLPVAKISDFGMSRLLDPTSLSSTLTAMGHRMGYLPPEAPRLEAERYDHSLDVFSLGVIMVQIIHKLKTVKTAKDRSYYVDQIPSTNPLKPLISICLQEDMKRRPTAQQVCEYDSKHVLCMKCTWLCTSSDMSKSCAFRLKQIIYHFTGTRGGTLCPLSCVSSYNQMLLVDKSLSGIVTYRCITIDVDIFTQLNFHDSPCTRELLRVFNFHYCS